METNNNTQKISISDKIKHIEEDVLNMDKSDDTVERASTSEPATGSSTTKGNPRYYYIAAAVVPVLIAGVLYTMQPKFVSKKCKGGKTKLVVSKLIKWTVGITILLWMGLYGYMRYKQLV